MRRRRRRRPRRCRRRRGAPSRRAASRGRRRGGPRPGSRRTRAPPGRASRRSPGGRGPCAAPWRTAPAMSVSSSTPRRTQNDRSLSAGRSGPRSMATKRSSTETSSKSELSSVDLPVARSPKMISVRRSLEELGQLGALAAGERAALEQAAEGRGDHAGGADLAGVHHRGVREERRAPRDEVLEVRRHLRLEQAAQDLEVLARALADARALELADRRVDLLDERDLDGAQRLVAAVGAGAAAAARRARRRGAAPGAPSRGGAAGMSFSAVVMSVHARRRHARRARPPVSAEWAAGMSGIVGA